MTARGKTARKKAQKRNTISECLAESTHVSAISSPGNAAIYQGFDPLFRPTKENAVPIPYLFFQHSSPKPAGFSK
jgi:hypothetical protein